MSVATEQFRLTKTLDNPFPSCTRLALDIETDGLDPLTNNIILIAVSDGESAVAYDVRNLSPDEVRDWLQGSILNRTVIAHNAAFDFKFLVEKYGVEYPKEPWDTMLAEQLLTSGKQGWDCDLASVAARRLNIWLDKSHQTTFTMEGEISPEQVKYACEDVLVLHRIAEQQREELKRERMSRVWEIERNALSVFAEMERRGINVDLGIMQPLLDETRATAEKLEAQLQLILTPHVMWKRIEKEDEMQAELDAWLEALECQTKSLEADWQWIMEKGSTYEDTWTVNKWDDEEVDKKDGKPKGMKRYVKHHLKDWRLDNPRPPKPKRDLTPINLNSQQQVLAAFASVGIPITDLKATTVNALIPDADPKICDEILEPFRQYKKAAKTVQAFGSNLLNKIGPDNRLHGSFRQIGTETGRPTSSNPNMLQMPSDQRFRSAFRAAPGKKMIVCDYSQMELRILAELSEDPVMIDIFKNDLDIHTSTAASIYTDGVLDDVTDKQRKTAKVVNFLTSYGGGANTLRINLAGDPYDPIFLSKEEAQFAIDSWREKLAYAWGFLETEGKKALAQGYTATPFGRRRYFDVYSGMDRYAQFAVQRAGANHVIQGTNADITKLAMILVQEQISPYGSVVLNVYDELVVEVDEHAAEYALEVVRESMRCAAETVLKTVPVKVDAVISHSWSENDVV